MRNPRSVNLCPPAVGTAHANNANLLATLH
uniref:Uncharacterized protein n=1 Tax=Anguilla anguilla TaxID=7936 RepID=A0A0E9UZZ2_ANGAN